MSFGYVLAWFVGTLSAATVLRLVRSRSRGRGPWIAVHGVLLTVLLVVSLRDSLEVAGYVTTGLWLVFSFLPALASRRMQQYSFRNDFVRAERIARAVAWLHPFGDWRYMPRLFRGLALEQKGEEAEASRCLDELEKLSGFIARSALLARYRMRGQWEEVLERIRLTFDEQEILRDTAVFLTFLRALGETGAVNELALAARRLDDGGEPTAGSIRDLARLFAFAFGGRNVPVARLLERPFDNFPSTVKTFWMATALMAAGRETEGRAMLEPLAHTEDRLLRAGIARRLQRGLPTAEAHLSTEARRALDELEASWDEERHFGPGLAPVARRAMSPRHAYVTQAIMAACALAFIAEIYLGGSTDGETLIHMGALLVTEDMPLEPWRLLAANFLHFGPVHLGMNLLGLLVLGPFVERSLGWWRYALTYLLSGVLSMASVYVTSGLMLGRNQILVGASGGIMGLVGATAAVLFIGWRRDGSVSAGRRLRSVGSILLFQALFDLATPAVSMTAHLSGALFGFVLGWLAFLTIRKS